MDLSISRYVVRPHMYFADVFAICDYTLHICATPPLPTNETTFGAAASAAHRGARLHVNAPQIAACPAKKSETIEEESFPLNLRYFFL